MSKQTKFTRFLTQGGCFKPVYDADALSSIAAGVYEVDCSMTGEVYFVPKPIIADSYIELPSMVTASVLQEIETFWNPKTKDNYNKFGITYKRGIILYGKPGTGKTCTVMKVIADCVKKGGIAIYNPSPKILVKAVHAIRDIQGDVPLVCVFEEFDKYCNSADFLSLLDGELQLDNIVYLATTNYIDTIPDSLKKRPSRFAKVVHVGEPDHESRLAYLRTRVPHLDYQTLCMLADKTEGFVMDQIKDVVISTQCFDIPLKEAIKTVRALGSKGYIGLKPDENEDEDEDEDDHE